MAQQGRMSGLFDAFDRLSTREKFMVGGLFGAFLLVGVVVVWMVIGGQINELESRNAAVSGTLSDVMMRKDAYLQQKAILDANKSLLDNNRLRLVKEMESQAEKLGFTIDEFKEAERPLTENFRKKRPKVVGAKKRVVKDLVELSQTITMRRISLLQLTKFMGNLEGRPEPVKVTRLIVKTLSSDRQVLADVRMTVATYVNKEVSQ